MNRWTAISHQDDRPGPRGRKRAGLLPAARCPHSASRGAKRESHIGASPDRISTGEETRPAIGFPSRRPVRERVNAQERRRIARHVPSPSGWRRRCPPADSAIAGIADSMARPSAITKTIERLWAGSWRRGAGTRGPICSCPSSVTEKSLRYKPGRLLSALPGADETLRSGESRVAIRPASRRPQAQEGRPRPRGDMRVS